MKRQENDKITWDDDNTNAYSDPDLWVAPPNKFPISSHCGVYIHEQSPGLALVPCSGWEFGFICEQNGKQFSASNTLFGLELQNC